MPPRRTNLDRNQNDEQRDLDAYEQPMSEKAGVLTELVVDMRYVRRDVEQIKEGLSKNYVTQEAFEPVKRIVYGLVALVLVGVVTALMAVIIK